MSERTEKFASLVLTKAAEYIQRESAPYSLITVTRVHVTDDLSKADVMISVLPENEEGSALEFLKRREKDFHLFLKKTNSSAKRLPRPNFQLDAGEKNRRNIEEISQSIK